MKVFFAMKNSKEKDYLSHSFFLLLFSGLIAYGISLWMSQYEILGYEIKEYDPLGDLIKTDTIPATSSPSIFLEGSEAKTSYLEHPEETFSTIGEQRLETGKLIEQEVATSAETNEEIYKPQEISQLIEGTKYMEDFSSKKNQIEQIRHFLSEAKREPLNVAFLGDSFIEGDIFVGDFRNVLQEYFGGQGVGYVPLTSPVAQFRKTILHQFSDSWRPRTILHSKKKDRFLLGGAYDQIAPESSGANVLYTLPKVPVNLSYVSRATLLYIPDSLDVPIKFQINGEEEQTLILEKRDSVSILCAHTFRAPRLSSLSFAFPEEVGDLSLYGVYFDGNEGVRVDNYSLRGASGLQLTSVPVRYARELDKDRPYRLIILAYGLNAISAEENGDNYEWYRLGMRRSIQHLKHCFPNALFLVLSISDRGEQKDGNYQTLPAVHKLLRQQRKVAQDEGCLFWNTYQAMQDGGGITTYVQNRWAAKDYTHLSARGGAILSRLLLEDLLGADYKR